MKPTVKILVCVLAAGSAFAQNPSVIQNTRDAMNAVSDKSTAASNEALGIKQSPSAHSNPSAAPAKVVAAPVQVGPVAAKASKNSAAKPVAPKVVAVKAAASGSSAPKTVVLKTDAPKTDAPKTVAATSVAASPMSPKVPASALSAKTKISVAKAPVVALPANVKPAAAVVVATPVATTTKDKSAAQAGAPKSVASAEGKPGESESDSSLPLDNKYGANGRRDPFISPVVSHNSGATACTSGKKCLEIGSVNLRGVVHGENGFIAVVSNGLNKAYFLRENDPVFNGYVVKITGDSIVFQETMQDRLGKSFTREVTKKITTPAV